MATVRIEIYRNDSWTTRQEGALDITADGLAAQLPAYALQHPHRMSARSSPRLNMPTPEKRSRTLTVLI